MHTAARFKPSHYPGYGLTVHSLINPVLHFMIQIQSPC